MFSMEDTGNPKNYMLANELRLWASVLEMAVHDYLHGDESDSREAHEWIFDEIIEGPFNTFKNICMTLDLDPDAVQERLRKITPQQYGKYRKSNL